MKNYWKMRSLFDEIHWLTGGAKCDIEIHETGEASVLVFDMDAWKAIPCDDVRVYDVVRHGKKTTYYEKHFYDGAIIIDTNETTKTDMEG